MIELLRIQNVSIKINHRVLRKNVFFFKNVKGRVHVFFIRELDVPLLGESNLMGPKKSVELKFFTVAFFWGKKT